MSTKKTNREATSQENLTQKATRVDSVNQVTVIVRFVATPQLRETASGQHVTTAGVASNGPTGAEFHDVVL
jgi:hypothetical protein